MAKAAKRNPASKSRMTFTAAIADKVCARIANGESLRTICASPSMPSKSSVMKWLTQHREFADQYARARILQADALFDDILAIADTPLIGEKTIEKPTGKETIKGDMIEHRRLQIDARKWLAGKLAPKKYGDKSAIEVSGPNGGPVETKDVSARELIAGKLASLASRSGTGSGSS